MSELSTIKIKIGAVELTCRGPVDREQLEEVLSSIKTQLPELVSPQSGAPQGPTAAELLGRSGARTFGEKAGVVAYWLEEHGGRNEWRSGAPASSSSLANPRPVQPLVWTAPNRSSVTCRVAVFETNTELAASSARGAQATAG